MSLFWRPERQYILTSFNELGLSEKIVASVTQLGYTTPTPIQAKAIPLLLEGRDLIGLAQTGTGKTAAFGLPIIEMLMKQADRPANRTTRTLILAPTRELVNQIGDNLRSFVKKTPLRINQVVGGASINKQQLQLERALTSSWRPRPPAGPHRPQRHLALEGDVSRSRRSRPDARSRLHP